MPSLFYDTNPRASEKRLTVSFLIIFCPLMISYEP